MLPEAIAQTESLDTVHDTMFVKIGVPDAQLGERNAGFRL